MQRDPQKLIEAMREKYGELPEANPQRDKEYLDNIPNQVEELRKKLAM